MDYPEKPGQFLDKDMLLLDLSKEQFDIGKYAYSLSFRELNKNIDTTLMSK